jgi:hypothetical protein
VDAFLEHLGRFYEIVVYSDQLSMVSLSKLSSICLYGKCVTWNKLCCMHSMLILSLIGWIQRAISGTGYQELRLNMNMENIIGYVRSTCYSGSKVNYCILVLL